MAVDSRRESSPTSKPPSKIITLPSYQERVLFMGSNGGGKTVLAGEMLAGGYPRTVSIDIKGDFDPPMDYKVLSSPNDWGWHYARHIMYRPSRKYTDGLELDFVLRKLFDRAKRSGKRRPFVLYIDEGLYVALSSRTGTMRSLAVTGRSLNLGLWVSSQRPRFIPVEVRSEAWRWYVFYLSYEDDEKEVIKYTKGRITLAELQNPTDLYSFWEIKRGKKSAGRLSIEHYPRVNVTPK
jgi:hypothetical protein